MKKLITYIFPCYNEELGLDKLYEEMLPIYAQAEEKYDVEVICINDGSKDKTLEKLIEIHDKDPRYTIINFARNFGHQIAITAGMDMAKGDAVIIMDSDLQDPPTVSWEMIQKWEQGWEVVYGQRKAREGESAFKKLTAWGFYRVLDSLADIRIPKDTGDFRLMDRKVIDTIKQFREKNRFMRGMVAYVGFKQTGVLFDRPERFAGTTQYPLKKMVKLALDGITGFSAVPLKLITKFGFGVSILSFLGVLYAIAERILSPQSTVPGWALTVVAIFFLGGVQMIMLGILGTYIGRIYSEVQNRPLYIVSSVFAATASKKD
jgi:polyisoprenyl-phosphate glycosyltransferase